jgi:Flp pilus assembly protein CpaB
MRASTLFAITIAILLGLAAAITVKVTGYFSNPSQVAPAKAPEIPVLVAARNLFKGDMIDGGWVQVRMLRGDEIKDYEQNRDKYLPPVPNAAVMRIAAVNIEADKPILKEHLIALADTKPGPISSVLLPNMRAVDLVITKEHSVGGLIQVGEWVDVLFTTQITVNGASATRTAPVANKVRVIAKRDTLWKVFGALPADKPVPYTLEMNPYRAALVEYCKGKGILSIIPVSAAEQKSLEDRRVALQHGLDIQQVGFAPPKMEDSAEYADEDERVDAINNGDKSIGTRDLVRIFGLQTMEPPGEASKHLSVETYIGNKRVSPTQFNKDGTIYEDPNAMRYGLAPDPVTGQPTAVPKPIFRAGTAQSPSGIDFNAPDLQFQIPGEKGCKNCKKKKEEGSVAP